MKNNTCPKCGLYYNPATMKINWYLEQLGDKFRKLTLHSENPKHPNMIWQATPNQHTSKYKQGVRGETPEEALENLCLKVLGSYTPPDNINK